MKLQVIVAEDHPVFADGLRMLLSTVAEIEHVDLVADGNMFSERIKSHEYDIAFVDIRMPGMSGIDAMLLARLNGLKLKFIVITAFESSDYIGRAISAGASAYILKDAPKEEIIEAIRKVAAGQRFFSPRIVSEIVKLANAKSKQNNTSGRLPALTAREYEILRLICLGHNRHNIAQSLFISERTFDKHKENILKKTTKSNAVDLVVFALQNKLVDISA